MCLKYVECEKNSCQKKMKKKFLYDMFKGNHKIEFKKEKSDKNECDNKTRSCAIYYFSNKRNPDELRFGTPDYKCCSGRSKN